MKTLPYKLFLFNLFIIFCCVAAAQDDYVDSLKKVLATEKEDTNKINTLNDLSYYLSDGSDSINTMQYARKALSLAIQLNFKKGITRAYLLIGYAYETGNDYNKAFNNFIAALKITKAEGDKDKTADVYFNLAQLLYKQHNYTEAIKNFDTALSLYEKASDKPSAASTYDFIATIYNGDENYPEALKNQYSALRLYEELNDKINVGSTLQYIAGTNYALGNDSEALKNLFASLKVRKEIGDKWPIAQTYISIGDLYGNDGNYSRAKQYDNQGLKIFKELGKNAPSWGLPFGYGSVADDYEKEGQIAYATGNNITANDKFNKALEYRFLALKLWENTEREDGVAGAFSAIGILYTELKKVSSARYYLEKGLKANKKLDIKSSLRDTYSSLSTLDSMEGNYKQAYEDYKLYILYRDSLNNEETKKKSLRAKMQYDFDKKESIAKAAQGKKDAEAKRIKNQQYFAMAALGVVVLAVVIIAFTQFKNNKQKQKANIVLEKTLDNLKSTQAQLIQSEKMASLGELTAGIAHEIQNPLNFVNNFSEVNKELLIEMKDEMNKGNLEDANSIANDVIDNEEKINHHGKRADAIVKGMLQHSRKSEGKKEPTDINALCDEYLRLAYNGLKAKDKDFDATMKTDFDLSLKKINIIPQDIGRVLLNLFNNAFYAMNEKSKTADATYYPIVLIQTKRLNDAVEIKVEDNGNGIPQNIIDKIFQPFFTTKPTGQGTGLGLSLAYDIITKEHNGTIKVESKVDVADPGLSGERNPDNFGKGEGSKFIIELPVTK